MVSPELPSLSSEIPHLLKSRTFLSLGPLSPLPRVLHGCAIKRASHIDKLAYIVDHPLIVVALKLRHGAKSLRRGHRSQGMRHRVSLSEEVVSPIHSCCGKKIVARLQFLSSTKRSFLAPSPLPWLPLLVSMSTLCCLSSSNLGPTSISALPIGHGSIV